MTTTTQVIAETARTSVETRFELVNPRNRLAPAFKVELQAPGSMARATRPIDPSTLRQHKPDAHWELFRNNRLVGRYSLWWRRTPVFRAHHVGFIGHYAVDDDTSDVLLRHACGQLAKRGCTLAVGPIDGNTWRTYRFITDFGKHPRFLLEPDHPPQWPAHFTREGFEPCAHYFSALCGELTCEDPRVMKIVPRLTAAGVRVRPILADAFEADLRRIFAVARVAFCDNLLYSEPSEEEFLEECRPFASRVPHDLVLLAEHAGRPVGFVFALPDLLQSRRGEPIDTIVVKTLAALPERRLAGLGQWLLAEVQHRAHDLGFRQAIHAMVRDAGHLRRISGRMAEPIRKYTLFAKVL
ncbi:MAG: GNAT family N-acetyltransferase [Planctomycetaceae bacterium]